MHNCKRLVKGKDRCTLRLHPDDAAARGLTDGEVTKVASSDGEIRVAVEISDEMMPGVVSLPHGWGHGGEGVRMRVAAAHAGVNANEITIASRVDVLSGTSALNGVPVDVGPEASSAQ